MIRDYLLANGYKESSQKNGNLVKYDGNESVVFTAEMMQLINTYGLQERLRELQALDDSLDKSKSKIFQKMRIRISVRVLELQQELKKY